MFKDADTINHELKKTYKIQPWRAMKSVCRRKIGDIIFIFG